MQRYNSIIIIIVGTLAMFILCMVMVTNVRPLYWTERATTTGSEACGRVARGFKEQRDRLSAHLNRMMQQVGMKSCEIEELLSKMNNKTKQFKEKHVSINGGWCEKESSPSSSSHVFDVHFASALADFLQGEKVASFGDGPGEYKKYMDKSRKVALYDAYDGAPYCEKTTNGIVKFLDLTAPQYGLPVYDWVVSVEVAEHIPAKYESVYLDNIFRHAQQGIILSWAVPGQGGLSHVNLKSLEDVINLMLDNGYKLDPYAGKVLRKAASVSWLKQNINVYRRISKTALSPDNA